MGQEFGEDNLFGGLVGLGQGVLHSIHLRFMPAMPVGHAMSI